MKSGQKLKHKHSNIEIELVEPTNNGWKVLQLDKTIKPRNTKWVTKHFSNSEVRDLFKINENIMNRENLKNVVRLVNETISKKLNESSDGGWKNTFVKNAFMKTYTVNESTKLTESKVPPFPNKREAMFAIQDVMDGTMTQKNFINQLLAAKRSGNIDVKNIKLLLGQLRMDAQKAGVELEQIIDRLIDKYQSGDFKAFNESKRINENPTVSPPAPAPRTAARPTAQTASAPVAPVEQGIDPAWKLDMIDFIGNSFQGQAKQFLYQAKKSNPKATPEQISAMVKDLIDSKQLVELFKTRFFASIKAAI
jgi:hypothetical protein